MPRSRPPTSHAVSRAGGLPFVLPDRSSIRCAADVLDALDGLVLAGGGDIDPSLYGEAAAPEVVGVDPHRDRYELALFRAATATGMPVLGICRGLQLINVARGGTLVQHIPTVTGMVHRIDEQAMEPVHSVSVVPGSLLAEVLGHARPSR